MMHGVIAIACIFQIVCDTRNYTYIPDAEKPVAFVRGNYSYVGWLDIYGNFIQLDRIKSPASRSWPAFPRWIGRSWKKGLADDIVYEYKSDKLVKGFLDKDGLFVPELDAEIVDFRDYKYSPFAIRIYNLPGTFEIRSRK
jgi:hypothetical protein